MTTLESAMADTSKLAEFDGRSVVRTTISVTNAGDGLSKALSIDPQEFHHGDVVYVVLECEVSKVTHVPIDKETPDVLIRQHTLRAGTGTIVDGGIVADYIDAQAAEISAAERHARGEFSLDEAVLLDEHEAGGHVEALVAGCPDCDAEAAAIAAENNDTDEDESEDE